VRNGPACGDRSKTSKTGRCGAGFAEGRIRFAEAGGVSDGGGWGAGFAGERVRFTEAGGVSDGGALFCAAGYAEYAVSVS
jgi:hypothetical protein